MQYQILHVSASIKCILITFSITLLCSFYGNGQERVNIGLLDRTKISTLLISPTQGNYIATNAKSDTIYTFRSDDAISVSTNDSTLIIKSVYGANDTLRELCVAGNGGNPSFKIRVNDQRKELSFFGDLTINVKSGQLTIVNSVDLESYIGRVIQAEVGHGATEEYYKIQSIICRTYAAKNENRHTKDGYNLCDHEHCQVYLGSKVTSNEIVKATASTNGLVMVSDKNELVLSAFHANCGGQTANCEDVWKEPRSYLKSVKDTFCLSSRSATWDKSIDVNELATQLGFNNKLADTTEISFTQTDRKKFFVLGTDSIELEKMRRMFHLRSTYFDLKTVNNLAELSGRGYGHGVGLCQQGAMKMAEFGYGYSQILGYYYKGVSLIQIADFQAEK